MYTPASSPFPNIKWALRGWSLDGLIDIMKLESIMKDKGFNTNITEERWPFSLETICFILFTTIICLVFLSLKSYRFCSSVVLETVWRTWCKSIHLWRTSLSVMVLQRKQLNDLGIVFLCSSIRDIRLVCQCLCNGKKSLKGKKLGSYGDKTILCYI